MASAYGIARKYNKFIPPVNLELLGKAMEVKQQKFDTNFTNLQSTIDLMGNVDLVKDADRQYFGERVKGLIEDVNNYGQIDLSSNAVTAQIQSHIKQAIDDNVMNGMEGTAKYRKYMAEAEDYKKNKPEKYNEINRMYGLLPFAAWKNDGQAGTSYGALEYTPYVDIEKKQNDFMAEIVKSKGIGKMDYLDGRGNKITISTWGLSDEEIRRIAESRFDQQDEKQLEINGWYTMAGANTEQAQGILQANYEQQKGVLEYEISEREEKLKSTVKGEKRDRLAGEVYQYKSRLKNLTDDTNSLKGKSAAVIGRYMAKEKIIGDMVSVYKEDEVGREVGKDDVFFENIKVNQEWTKIDIQNKEHQLNVDKYNDEKEEKRLKAEKEKLDSTYTIDLNIDGKLAVKMDDIIKETEASDKLLENQLNDILSHLPEPTRKMLANATNEEKLNVLTNSSRPELVKYKTQLANYAYTMQQNKEVKEGLHENNAAIVRAKALELGAEAGKKGVAYYEPLIKGYKNLYLDNHDGADALKYKGLMVSAMMENGMDNTTIKKYVQQVEEAYVNGDWTVNKGGKRIRISKKTALAEDPLGGYATVFSEETPDWVKKKLEFTKEEQNNYKAGLVNLQRNVSVNQAKVITTSNSEIGSIRAIANGYLVAFGQNKEHPIEEGQNLVVYKDPTKGTDQYIITAGVKETAEGFKGTDASGGDRTITSMAKVPAHIIEAYLKKGGINVGAKLDAVDFKNIKLKGGKMLDKDNSDDIPSINYITSTLGGDLPPLASRLDRGGLFTRENTKYFVTKENAIIPIDKIYDEIEYAEFKPQQSEKLNGDKAIDVYIKGEFIGTANFAGSEWSADMYKSLYLAKGIIINKMLLQGVRR